MDVTEEGETRKASLEKVLQSLSYESRLTPEHEVQEFALGAIQRIGAAAGVEVVTIPLFSRFIGDPETVYLDIISNVLHVVGKDPKPLASKGYGFLEYLMNNAGRTCEYMEIFNAVWPEHEGLVEMDYVRQYGHKIRARLGDDFKDRIKTVFGVGYMYDGPVGSFDTIESSQSDSGGGK